MPEFVVRPVTPENWTDFAALFAARGGPHYCWCTIHRFAAHRGHSSVFAKLHFHRDGARWHLDV